MNLLTLPILIPLVGACICLLARSMPRVQAALAGITAHGLLVASGVLLGQVAGGRIGVLHIGGWPDGFAIVHVADRFAGLMLLLCSIILVVTWWFSVVGVAAPDGQSTVFHPLLLLLATSVNWSFLTADLFNLFVGFELMLICSYALMIDPRRLASLREGHKFVMVNAVVGTLFLMAAGLVYGAYGTLNLAELSIRVELDPTARGILFGSLLLVVFGMKAAVFPLFTWLPTAYPATPLAVLPFITGLLTKVGVYTLYRMYTLVFSGSLSDWFQPLLLGIGGITMLLGVLAALSRWSMREILSIHIVSQIGYMVFGLGLLTPLGLAGGMMSVAHNVIVKTALFLVAAVVAVTWGGDRLKDLGGIMGRSPVLGLLFLLAAMSLAGLPPFSGFFCKWLLTLEGFREGRWIVTTVAVLTGLLTLASMLKIWLYAFWGESPAALQTALPRAPLIAVTGGLVALSLLFILVSGPLTDFLEAAARQMLDPSAYREAVLGPLAIAAPADLEVPG